MTSTGIAAPPETQSRSDEVSSCSRSGWLSIAAYIVGTPSKTVDLVALDDLQRLAGIEARDQRQAAAAEIVAFSPQVWPKEWNSGSAPSITVVLVRAPNSPRGGLDVACAGWRA